MVLWESWEVDVFMELDSLQIILKEGAWKSVIVNDVFAHDTWRGYINCMYLWYGIFAYVRSTIIFFLIL